MKGSLKSVDEPVAQRLVREAADSSVMAVAGMPRDMRSNAKGRATLDHIQ